MENQWSCMFNSHVTPKGQGKWVLMIILDPDNISVCSWWGSWWWNLRSGDTSLAKLETVDPISEALQVDAHDVLVLPPEPLRWGLIVGEFNWRQPVGIQSYYQARAQSVHRLAPRLITITTKNTGQSYSCRWYIPTPSLSHCPFRCVVIRCTMLVAPMASGHL